jgi:hypothetical protein
MVVPVPPALATDVSDDLRPAKRLAEAMLKVES